MRYGIISDIHANLEALEVAIDALSREKIDKYLCVGDIVGYGADPTECIRKTRALDPVVVLGNHDAASCGLRSTRDFNEPAKNAILWTQKNIETSDIDFLKSLEMVYKNRDLTLAHGTLQEPEEFHYMLHKNDADATFALMDTPVCFVGHSHSPGIFSGKQGKVDYFYKEKVKISKSERMIVNTGSVGQPRDGDPRLCYSVYDSLAGTVELKRLPYDVPKAQKKILKAGLPPFLASRLGDGM